MSKFAIKTYQAVQGQKTFKDLVILGDNQDALKIQAEIDMLEAKGEAVSYQGEFEKYEDALPPRYKASCARIVGNMNRVSNMQNLPLSKYKEVTPAKESVKEYEYKYEDLRAWTIKTPYGQLILHGGFKSTQPEGFRAFRSLKEKYLKSQQ
jgi:hypothetical protein